jgi:hypothetical protein
VLYINDAAPTIDDPDSAPETMVNTAPVATDSAPGPDVLARVLGGVGLVLGVVALLIATVGRRPARKAS